MNLLDALANFDQGELLYGCKDLKGVLGHLHISDGINFCKTCKDYHYRRNPQSTEWVVKASGFDHFYDTLVNLVKEYEALKAAKDPFHAVVKQAIIDPSGLANGFKTDFVHYMSLDHETEDVYNDMDNIWEKVQNLQYKLGELLLHTNLATVAIRNKVNEFFKEPIPPSDSDEEDA